MRVGRGEAMLVALVLTFASGAQAQGPDQDRQFLRTAQQGDLTEMALGKLALAKSHNPQVKELAQTILQDHSKMESSMQPFAQQLQVAPATILAPEHQQLVEKLRTLSGADFDKQYVSDVDTDHQAALEAYRTEIGATGNRQLKAAVTEGAKMVAHHLEMANKLASQLGGPSTGE